MPKDTNRTYNERHPKIDIFDDEGKYLCSTQWYRTCEAALDASTVPGARTAIIDRDHSK